MTTLLDRLDTGFPGSRRVISWSCPVPFFGNVEGARIATVGINPSNREFMGEDGLELTGASRRLPTLQSLELAAWSDAVATQLQEIAVACATYFRRNPYDRWFRVLETLLSHTAVSLYSDRNPAAHLDLVPYATTDKWTSLSTEDRRALLAAAGDALGLLLRDSPVELLVLNGMAVVRHFEFLSGNDLVATEMPAWDLRRKSLAHVRGIAYAGVIDTYAGVALPRAVTVIGYNHNLQSSFGVTSEAVDEISSWVGHQAEMRFA